MRNTLISFWLIASILLLPLRATAGDLETAFQSFMPGTTSTINTPGAFSAQGRGGFTAGGVDVRFARNATAMPSLLSITPPKISAGCNGISAHFGGFSFISGQEFAKLIKTIASGAAMGFVTSLVMKTLCPPCEAIVQELKTAAQMASKNLKDACKWGQEMGAKFAGGESLWPDNSNTCAGLVASANDEGDTGNAWANTCKSITSAGNAIKDFLGSAMSNSDGTPASDSAVKAALTCDFGYGNLTWGRLSAFDFAGEGASDDEIRQSNLRKLLLINMIGADLMAGPDNMDASCVQTSGKPLTTKVDEAKQQVGGAAGVGQYCQPPASTAVFTGLFMCGAPDSSGNMPDLKSETLKKYCSGFFGDKANVVATTTQLWTCEGDDFKQCQHLVWASPSTVLNGKGFVVQVHDLLMEAVARVRDGTVGFGDDTGKKIISLIQVAPYPLYQAINAAAVYPAAGTELVESMSVLVAEQFAYALIDDYLKVSNRTGNPDCHISKAQSNELLGFITNLRMENKTRLEAIGKNFALQQGITKQIQEINLTIQQQVMSADLVSTGRMAQSINTAVSTTGK